MRKVIDFGKVDANGTGRKINKITVEVELKDTDKGKVLSLMGNVWNEPHTDIISGGQNYEEMERLKGHNPLMRRIIAIWKRWHLNDLHAGCEHQIAYGYESKPYEENAGKKCHFCNHMYGTAWKFEPLPKEVIDEVESWQNIGTNGGNR
jgi:hypothetical protein